MKRATYIHYTVDAFGMLMPIVPACGGGGQRSGRSRQS
jgi:hypothetical protein